MRKQTSGWHAQYKRFRIISTPEPAQPTRWDEMLGELGITQDAALELLGRRAGDGTTTRIEVFVERYCLTHYIPVLALRLLGLEDYVAAKHSTHNTRRGVAR